MRVFIFLVAFIGFYTLSVHAQTVKLTGKIINEKNEPLQGVSITAEGTSIGSSTNAEGSYSLNLIPGVKYRIKVSSVGYTPKLISDVDVTARQINELDIVLEYASVTQTAVVVTATSRRQESTASLLNFQKNNTALSSGLAADFIRRTPDKNTGEVLRRVSGTSIQDNKFVIVRGLSDRYNSAFINGAVLPSSEPDKKAFSFDVIPSGLIDNIIINKTATPDLTGEFAGGIVQITTKDIPARNELNVGIGLGFNTQSVFKDFVSNERSSTDWLGFSNNRDLPSSYPKKYLDFNKLSSAEQIAVAKSFDNAYNEVKTTAGPIQQYNLTWANVEKGKSGSAFGSVVGLTYRKSKLLYPVVSKELVDKSYNTQFDYVDEQFKYSVNWGAVANFAWTKNKHKIAFKNLYNQLLEDNYYRRSGYNTEQEISLRSSVLNQRSLYSTQLEGTHQFGFKDIKLAWNLNYAYNNKSQPDLRVQTYSRPLSSTIAYAINLRGNNTNRFYSDLTDHAYGYNASASMPFTLGKQKHTLKVGGSATLRVRDFEAIILGFKEPTDQSLYTLPYDQIFSSNNFSETGFQLSTDLQNPQDEYYGASALSAGYFMLDNKLSNKFRLVWGSRFENFEQFIKSNKQGTDKAQIVNTDKFDVLPSMNLTFSPNTKTNLRFAASRTVARPEFREIAEFAFFDFEQIASIAGNPLLKRSSIINGDIRYEFYPKAGELLSLGVFYKNFKDPIELRLNSASGPSRRQYEFQNAEKAELFGIEAEFRKKLSFLTSKEGTFLDNIYFNGNVSVIFSDVLLGNLDTDGNKLPPTSRPIQGQSPYLINAGLQYDGPKGTNVSLLYNRIGERLSLVGNDDFGDIYEKPRNLVDFQVSQKVMKNKGEVRLTIGDILNEHFATYENKDTKKTYKASADRNFGTYEPGTTFTIGFNYNFSL